MIEFGILEPGCLLNKFAGLTTDEKADMRLYQTKLNYFMDLYTQMQAGKSRQHPLRKGEQ